MPTNTHNQSIKNKIISALPFIAVSVALFAVMFFFGTHLKHLAIVAFSSITGQPTTSSIYDSSSSVSALYDAPDQVATTNPIPETGACLCPLCCSAPTE